MNNLLPSWDKHLNAHKHLAERLMAAHRDGTLILKTAASADSWHPNKRIHMDIETEIQAKGLTAPRITPQHIEDCIEAELYFTAGQAARGLNLPTTPATDLLTFCVLTLKNGFTVTGESACASPENFNAEIGQKIARDNAKNKIWALEGYVLKNALAAK